MSGREGEADPAEPLLRVVGGAPTDEELAALAVVVAGIAGAPAAPTPDPPRSRWSDRGSLLRRPSRPGANGWRDSARPR